MIEMRTPKGTKDYLPEEQEIRERIRDALVETFRLYNFGALETPILENFEVLASKYAGGQEILKETYQLQDQGKRELGLRYDLTIPFARVISMNPNLRMPFKRWEIGKVFRDGPLKVGRYREFTQCDVDVVGIKSCAAEAEFLSMSFDVLDRIGLDAFAEVNNMKLLSNILKHAGVEEKNIRSAILSVDKLKKIGEKGVKTELMEKGIKKIDFDLLFELLNPGKTNDATLSKLSKKIVDNLGKEGIDEMKQLFSFIKSFEIKGEIRFVPSLARGLEIYTGTIFEFYAKGTEMNSSIAGGGRYDNIIGKFLESEKEYPAVGISFGLDAICDVLKNKTPEAIKKKGSQSVYVISINQMEKAIEVTSRLRKAGITADINYSEKKIGRELEYANKSGFSHSIIIGEKEIKDKKVQLRDMTSGNQALLSIEEAIDKMKKHM